MQVIISTRGRTISRTYKDALTQELAKLEPMLPKSIETKPLDETVAQLRLGRDDFLVFANASTGAVNVLYRRRDGGLGLIEPAA